jgi:TM2 domain-containing membrane protein YozV
MFCSSCGAKNEDSAKFCGGCGFNLITGTPGLGAATQSVNLSNQAIPEEMVLPSVPPKSPFLAAFLSFLICGLGQFYLGQKKKFLAAILVAVLLLFTGVLAVLSGLIWIVMILDAYFIGKKLEAGKAVKQWEFF